MSNRPSGVLTETDREFLQSDGDYYEGDTARQSAYQRRRDIRGRITQSLLDFQDIRTYLDGKLRQQIFEEPTKNGAETDIEFGAAIESLLYWLYLGCRENGPDFSRVLETSVRRAEEDYRRKQGGDIVDVEVDFDIEVTERYEGIEELSQRLMDGESVLADAIYRIPTLPQFPIDVEQVDVVRIQPSSAQMHMSSEKEIVETILREHLGVEAEVEVVGVAEMPEDIDIDFEYETAAVSPEEYDR